MDNSINFMDIKILHLAIVNDGKFDEATIENSELKKLGVGRILDLLASLKERDLIKTAENKFTITRKGRDVLWNNSTPLWSRILHILEIKSLEIHDIAKYLNEPKDPVLSELEKLRKKHLVLMSPQREDSELKKVYEITQDGKEKLEVSLEENKTKSEISKVIGELIDEVNQTLLNEKQKQTILEKIHQIKRLSNV